MAGKKKGKLICDVGINDADYITQPTINGKTVICPFYKRWFSMIVRCYSKNSLETNKTYSGCSVIPKWHSFMNFKSWMENQDWEDKCLDKDLLIKGNKIYSPDTCVFITHEVNCFLVDQVRRRGGCPIGVYKHKDGKYVAQTNHNGEKFYLGWYDYPEQAHKVWLKKKLELAKGLALKQNNSRVAEALVSRYDVEIYE